MCAILGTSAAASFTYDGVIEGLSEPKAILFSVAVGSLARSISIGFEVGVTSARRRQAQGPAQLTLGAAQGFMASR